MKILHLIHGLFGNNNGVDRYIRNLLSADKVNENILVVPAGKNLGSEDIKNEIIEINSLYELENIVKDFEIDALMIHWRGSECFIDRKDIVRYKDRLISMSDTPVYTGNLDMNPDAYPDTAMLWNKDRKHKIFIISHACFKLPVYLSDFIDGVIHVSNAAKKVNEDLKTNHIVIYPAINETKLYNQKVFNENLITIGWLGKLNKINSIYYDEIKKVYGNNKSIRFIFAGEGNIDPDPPSNFEFIGVISPEEFFPQIDIFFYPTSLDSFSIALLEALSQDKITVVSDVVKELGRIGQSYVFTNQREMIDILNIFSDLRHLVNKSQNIREDILNLFSKENMIEKINTFISNPKRLNYKQKTKIKK